jgi:polyisoprenoid-binding protein YceI
MTLAPGSHTFGPNNGGGHLTVKTQRASLAAVAAHDLTLEVTEWEGTLEIGEDGGQARVELKADGGSLRVIDDEKGVTTLTDLDKESVHENIAAEVLKGTSITFRSTSTEESEEGRRLRVQGELELGGQTAQVDFELEIGEDEDEEEEDEDTGDEGDEDGKDEEDAGKDDHQEPGDAKSEHDDEGDGDGDGDEGGDEDDEEGGDDDVPEQDQNDRPISGTAVVKQSDFGIEPYSSLLGAINVADEVVVEFEGKLSP